MNRLDRLSGGDIGLVLGQKWGAGVLHVRSQVVVQQYPSALVTPAASSRRAPVSEWTPSSVTCEHHSHRHARAFTGWDLRMSARFRTRESCRRPHGRGGGGGHPPRRDVRLGPTLWVSLPRQPEFWRLKPAVIRPAWPQGFRGFGFRTSVLWLLSFFTAPGVRCRAAAFTRTA